MTITKPPQLSFSAASSPLCSLKGSLLTVAVLTFLYGLTAVLLTHFLAARMRANPVIARVLEKVAGVFLIGFGVKLAVSR